jgi:ATP-binding cassette subfamily B protein
MQQQRALRYLKAGPSRSTSDTFKRVWQYVRKYRGSFAIGSALMLVGVAIGIVPPLLIRQMIDVAIPQHDFKMALFLGSGLLLVPFSGAVLTLGQNFLSSVVAQGMIADLRQKLYDHTQSLGLDFFTWTPAGEIQTRFLNDAGNLQQVLTQSFFGTFANLVTVVGTLVVMAFINWELTLAAALALPAFAFPVLHFGRRRYAAVEIAQAALGDLTTVLSETLSLSGAVVVKSFGTEERESSRFAAVNELARKAQVAQILEGQWLVVIVQGLAALGPAVLYTYGAYLVIHGQIELGTIVAFATYMAQLYSPASSLAGANASLLGGLAMFDRVFEILDIPPGVPEPVQPQPLPATTTSGIRFEDVSFRYPAGIGTDNLGIEVLREISFEAAPGRLVALVGPSGAGKSTILSLAARFYDPNSGRILLDDVPMTEIARPELRDRLAVVTQDVFLFHATLRENIAYGAPDAKEDAIEAVVEAAQLRDLVDRLPDGLETVVGERGFRLSGGEKQRVAIARALLRQAPYLLLDEATSSLDSQAERRIQLALERLIHGRTVIAIAHRLSTIQRADQILVVQNGQIVERGTHAELLQHSGLYEELYYAQFAADLDEATTEVDVAVS